MTSASTTGAWQWAGRISTGARGGSSIPSSGSTNRLRKKNSGLASENKRYGQYVGQWRDIRDSTYHDNLLRATVLLKAQVDQLVRDAGLGQIPVRPITGRAAKNCYWEIGCTIGGRASLERVTHLLFLLTRDGHLHRLSNLTISQPQSGQREVPFSLRYSPLVLHHGAGRPPPR